MPKLKENILFYMGIGVILFAFSSILNLDKSIQNTLYIIVMFLIMIKLSFLLDIPERKKFIIILLSGIVLYILCFSFFTSLNLFFNINYLCYFQLFITVFPISLLFILKKQNLSCEDLDSSLKKDK